ncbi:hypothetical protein [Rosettibacter firmus]|uniref:hypothetical protein n=1 Tax=Rosettibacter firmus TaxID=3111522 RepID=UPI00336BD718
MKKFIYLLAIITSVQISAQRIGELAPEKEPEKFPEHSWGIDLMFGEGGFGLGAFIRKNFTPTITGFADISISESKDEREVEYVDWYGNTFVLGKVNNVFLIPLNFGVQYRLFYDILTDNLRPYINAGIGPTFVVSKPYTTDFFSAFNKAKMHYAVGGYIGLGANFGISKKNLAGINIRYYYVHLFDKGVENMKDRFRKNFGHFYLTLNLGIMY